MSDDILFVAAVRAASLSIYDMPVIEKMPKPKQISATALAANDMVNNFVFHDPDANSSALSQLCLEKPNDFDATLILLHYMRSTGAFTADTQCITAARTCVRAMNAKGDLMTRVMLVVALVNSLVAANAFVDAASLASIIATRVVRCVDFTGGVSIALYSLACAGGQAAEKANLNPLAIGFYNLAWKLVVAAQEDYISIEASEKRNHVGHLMRLRFASARLIVLQCNTISASDFVLLLPFETWHFVKEQKEALSTAELLVALDICVRRRLVNREPYETILLSQDVERAHEILTAKEPTPPNRPVSFDAPKTCLVCGLVAIHYDRYDYCDLHIEAREKTRFD